MCDIKLDVLKLYRISITVCSWNLWRVKGENGGSYKLVIHHSFLYEWLSMSTLILLTTSYLSSTQLYFWSRSFIFYLNTRLQNGSTPLKLIDSTVSYVTVTQKVTNTSFIRSLFYMRVLLWFFFVYLPPTSFFERQPSSLPKDLLRLRFSN